MRERLRVGVIGLRFGTQVHVPAFRTDSRCEVTTLIGRDAVLTAELARTLEVPSISTQWRELIESPTIDAVSIAVPPALQAAIIVHAAHHRKHVFCEKPLASSVANARLALDAATSAGIVHVIDFMFPEVEVWQQARALLDQGAIGRLTHFSYTWRVETYASRTGADTWKTRTIEGGGALGNFGSHAFYNIEWLLGRIEAIEAFCVSGSNRAGRSADGVLRLQNGASGVISISTDAFLGGGHRIEVYGSQGTLVLENTGADYAAGFVLQLGTRDSGQLTRMMPRDPSPTGEDGRIAPVSRLVRRFVDAINGSREATPSLADGVRVQEWMSLAARVAQSHLSAHQDLRLP